LNLKYYQVIKLRQNNLLSKHGYFSENLQEKLGWEPSFPFESGVNQTIQWYCDHLQWIERINNGQYRMSE